MLTITRDMDTKTLASEARVGHLTFMITARSMGLGLKYNPDTHSYTIGRRSECIQILNYFKGK